MATVHYGYPPSPSNRWRKGRRRRRRQRRNLRSPIRDDDRAGPSPYGKRGWGEMADEDADERPAKRRKLSGFDHPLYVSRQQEGGGAQGRRVRRIIMEEEEDPIEDEEEEEERVELPAMLSDDEDEEEDAEVQRILARNCVGCRLILGMEKDVLPVVRPEITVKIDRIMFSGLKNRNTVGAAKLAAAEFARFVTEPLNAEREAVRQAPIPSWTWQSIRRHYKENHCDNDSFVLYEHMRKMESTVDAVRSEIAYLENSGPMEVDPQTGEKRRGFVKRYRVANAKLEHTMRKDLVVLRLRMKRERSLEEGRLMKAGRRHTGAQPPDIWNDIGTVRRGDGRTVGGSMQGPRRGRAGSRRR